MKNHIHLADGFYNKKVPLKEVSKRNHFNKVRDQSSHLRTASAIMS